MNDEEGLLDLADIEVEETPEGWVPEQDELPFDAFDEDDDSDG